MQPDRIVLTAAELYSLQSGGSVSGFTAAGLVAALTGLVTKDAANLHDPNPVEWRHVYAQLEGNFPDSALEWVKHSTWVGPVEVPWDRIDDDDIDKWAASHEPEAVNRFAKEIARGGAHTDPSVLFHQANHSDGREIIGDGHHRALARRKLGKPVLAYVGTVPARWMPQALEMHSKQIHSGSDPANKVASSSPAKAGTGPTARSSGRGAGNGTASKAAKVSKESVNYRPSSDPSRRCGTCVMYRSGSCTLVAGPIDPDAVCDKWYPVNTEKGAKGSPVAAGLAVRAADTGRVLMLQRAYDDDDPAGGYWELPGGRLDEDEEALEAAKREWAEEVGLEVPDGELTGLWNASNGRYRGFVLTVPSEDAVDIFGDRDEVSNPDDPDRDDIEALAWFDPKQLRDNPSIRPELAEDIKRVRRALKSAQTPIVSTVHHPLGHEGLWHTPDRHVSSAQQLPAYFQNTARALMRDDGMGEQEAIATAINAVKEWAEGRAFGGRVHVTPEVQAAARRALAEWAQLRQSHH